MNAPSLPAPLLKLFSSFPLYTYPATPSPNSARQLRRPTLWILPPKNVETNILSNDAECLKWQAYIALRGLSDIDVRWDVSSDGGIEGRLPNLHIQSKESNEQGLGELLPAHLIAEWVDGQAGDLGSLEGYIDEAARDESRAWVSLLEGKVHAALVSAPV